MLFASPKEDACGIDSSMQSILLLLCAVFAIGHSGVDELMTVICTILRRIAPSFVLINNGAALLAQMHCAKTEEFSIPKSFYCCINRKNTI